MRVIISRFLDTHGAARVVAIAPWTDASADDDRRFRRVIFALELDQHGHGVTVETVELGLSDPERLRPVGTRPPGGTFQNKRRPHSACQVSWRWDPFCGRATSFSQ